MRLVFDLLIRIASDMAAWQKHTNAGARAHDRFPILVALTQLLYDADQSVHHAFDLLTRTLSDIEAWHKHRTRVQEQMTAIKAYEAEMQSLGWSAENDFRFAYSAAITVAPTMTACDSGAAHTDIAFIAAIGAAAVGAPAAAAFKTAVNNACADDRVCDSASQAIASAAAFAAVFAAAAAAVAAFSVILHSLQLLLLLALLLSMC